MGNLSMGEAFMGWPVCMCMCMSMCVRAQGQTVCFGLWWELSPCSLAQVPFLGNELRRSLVCRALQKLVPLLFTPLWRKRAPPGPLPLLRGESSCSFGVCPVVFCFPCTSFLCLLWLDGANLEGRAGGTKKGTGCRDGVGRTSVLLSGMVGNA